MRFLCGLVAGLLLALLLTSTRPAEAQAVGRMFGTLSTGASKAILVTTAGAVQVTAQ